MQRKFIKKALIYNTLLQQIRLRRRCWPMMKPPLHKRKWKWCGKNVTSLLSSRQSTSDH